MNSIAFVVKKHVIEVEVDKYAVVSVGCHQEEVVLGR